EPDESRARMRALDHLEKRASPAADVEDAHPRLDPRLRDEARAKGVLAEGQSDDAVVEAGQDRKAQRGDEGLEHSWMWDDALARIVAFVRNHVGRAAVEPP